MTIEPIGTQHDEIPTIEQLNEQEYYSTETLNTNPLKSEKNSNIMDQTPTNKTVRSTVNPTFMGIIPNSTTQQPTILKPTPLPNSTTQQPTPINIKHMESFALDSDKYSKLHKYAFNQQLYNISLNSGNKI